MIDPAQANAFLSAGRIVVVASDEPKNFGRTIVRALTDHGIDVVAGAGACPLMFLEPVRGAHRVHRALRRANRSLARASA